MTYYKSGILLSSKNGSKENVERYRKYNQIWLLCLLAGLFWVMLTIVYLDPCFHYHSPLKKISYRLNDERYQNNGIVRNFEYNALITGTSMTENFKTSEMDDIFQVNSIKVAFSGGSNKEINDNLMVALENNSNIQMVLRCLDIGSILEDKDAPFHGIADQGYNYPHFMNDNNLFNDVFYVLNKEMLIKGLDNICYTRRGGVKTSFDDYSYWNDHYQFGADAVLESYQRGEKTEIIRKLTTEERNIILGNINQNMMNAASDYPNVEFYFFYSPYSIVWWDNIKNCEMVDFYIDIMEMLAKEALKYSNIKLFDFSGNYEVVCNLNNYKDYVHYSAEINSEILEWMKEDKYLLTEDNYKKHFEELREFYQNYDYDKIFDN